MFDMLTKRIVSVFAAAVLTMSNITSVYAEEITTATTEITAVSEDRTTTETSTAAQEDTELTYQVIELYPNEEEEKKVVTLDGLMPEGAEVTAVDVSEEHEGVAAYDITITDGKNEYQPGEENPIKVEIVDPVITEKIELWHIHDDGTREQIFDFSAEDGKVSFYATGFSVYEIVEGPEHKDSTITPVMAETLADLESADAANGFYMYVQYKTSQNGNLNKTYVSNIINNNGAFVLNSYNSPAEVAANSSTLKWYLEKNGDYFYLATDTAAGKKYVQKNGASNVRLVDKAQATLFSIDTNDEIGREGDNQGQIITVEPINAFHLKQSGDNTDYLQYSGNGKGIRFYKQKPDKDWQLMNYRLVFYYASSFSLPNDYCNLNGKTYGLMNYVSGAAGDALIAGNNGNAGALEMLTCIVRTGNDSKMLYVAQDTDITEWTFESVSEDNYYLYADFGGTRKYLHIGTDAVTISDEPQAIKVTPNADGKIMLSANGKKLGISGNSGEGDYNGAFIVSDEGVYLSFVRLTEIDDEFVTYKAKEISVSDAKNGDEVIIYTRVWNESTSRYEFYAIDHDGSLVPCYERGDSIMWLSKKINTMIWKFTEHYYEYTNDPNFYYDLYNPYSGKYIAPRRSDTSSPTLDDAPIGINLDGRRNGEYYSTILAWDQASFAYSGLKASIAGNNKKIAVTSRAKADTFYFARLVDLKNELTEVETVDNSQYGITMKMVNFSDKNSHSDKHNEQDHVLGDYTVWEDHKTKPQKGILSTNLENNEYPRSMQPDQNPAETDHTTHSLAELYENAETVNHLFIQSILEQSGYFEYDSCQNYATLKQADGSIGTKFFVSKELGTHDDGNKNTLKHGQFFPYDDIDMDTYSSLNSQNMYSATGDPLSNDDPRKYERLHLIESPDYYFGMELDAGFTQTPNGKDNWGHDIIFEFTGDDDFWLYVDGELVIDLGGIHSALAGDVNFATGVVHVNGETTNLRDIFRANYVKRGMTEAQIETELAKYFDKKDGEFEKVFKDYTNHTMKIFYMERGAGASNLHMRFNLSYVTPGHVTMTKQVSGSDDIDFDLVEYPFQIFYSEEEDQYGQPLHPQLLTYDDEYISVTYQNSTKKVIFQDSYTPPGSTQSFDNVFFINPHQSVEIHFPRDTTHYRIVECGINSEVYNSVSINGQPMTGTDLTAVGTASLRKTYTSDWVRVSERTNVVVDNHVDPDGLRSLTFQKKLFDSDYNKADCDAIRNDPELNDAQKTELLESYYNKHKITAEQDPTTFSFRLYLSNGLTDELALTNMFKYRIKDPEGYYCTWDIAAQKFVRYVSDSGTKYDADSLKAALDAIKEDSALTSDQKSVAKEQLLEPITFETSINGQITNVPAWFTVEVPNLPVGILFEVEERDGASERPLGYDRVQYERIEGTYITTEDTPDNVGMIRANESPQMNVINQRGYEVQAKKVWSDRDFAVGHDDIYTALFIKQDDSYELAPAATYPVRKLSAPDTEIRYFMRSLKAGTSLADYEVFEVKLTNPVTDANGYVTSYDSMTRIDDGSLSVLHATDRNTVMNSEETAISSIDCKDSSHESDWSIQTHFDSGSKIYGDEEAEVVDLPAKLRGAEYIRTANASKDYARELCSVDMDAAADLYVAVDSRIGTLSWLSEWTKDSAVITASNNVTYDLYRKGFGKSEQVTLGSNVGSGNAGSTYCNYFVMAAPHFSYKVDYEQGREVNAVNVIAGKKTWTEAQLADHSSVHTALYLRDGNGYRLADTSLYHVVTLTAPDDEVRYYINTQDIPKGMTLNHYKVCEVTLSDGAVASRGAELTTTNKTYTARADTITNTRMGGIEIKLYKMGTRDAGQYYYGDPLAGGVFTLKKGNEVIGHYTSDSNGRVTIMYNFERDTVYTLVQTAAPATFYMPPNPVTFSVSAGDNPTITVSGNDAIWNDYHLPNEQGNQLVAYIDIYNKPFTLKVIKTDKDDPEKLLDNVHFALYRAVTGVDGLVPDVTPMNGYEDLVTDAAGVIPRITQNLPEGTYFLKEVTPKPGYKLLERYIRFVINGNNVSIVGSTIQLDDGSGAGSVETIVSNTGVKLTKTDSADSYACEMQIPNEIDNQNYYFDLSKTILLDKNLHNSDDTQKFVFKVERLNGNTNTAVSQFYVTMNCTSLVTDALTLTESTDHKYKLIGTNPADCQVQVTYDNEQSYTFPAAVRSGTQTIHVGEAGRYRVSEVSGWSSTDYDFWKGSQKYVPKAGSTKAAESTGYTDSQDPYVIFTVDTADIDKTNCAAVSFTNTETEYAYLSAQAYAENTFNRPES